MCTSKGSERRNEGAFFSLGTKEKEKEGRIKCTFMPKDEKAAWRLLLLLLLLLPLLLALTGEGRLSVEEDEEEDDDEEDEEDGTFGILSCLFVCGVVVVRHD